MLAQIVGKFTDKHRRQFAEVPTWQEQEERSEETPPHVAQHCPILKRKHIMNQGTDCTAVNVEWTHERKIIWKLYSGFFCVCVCVCMCVKM